MNYSTAVFLINNQVRAIRVIYDPSDPRPNMTIYKTLDATIKKDDLVVIPTGTRAGFTVVKVDGVDVDIDVDSPIQIQWVVAKLNQRPYEDLLAQEASMIAEVKSAEMRAKRENMAAAIFKDQTARMKALPLAHMNGDDAVEQPPAPPPSS